MSEGDSENSNLLQQNAQDLPAQNRLRDVIILGIAFLFLFSAFTVVQNLATSVFNESAGFWALGTLYIVFSVANLAASSIVKGLGLRLSLFLGGATYVVYVVANVVSVAYESNTTLQYATLIPTAALLGVGAATLWTAQGTYLTQSASKANLGLYSGIFFTIFISNNIVGNVSAGILLAQDVETDTVFIILAIIGAIGIFIFWLLRPISKSGETTSINEQDEKKDDLPAPPKVNPIFEVILLLVDYRACLLAMILIYSGLTQTFFFGSLPLFINQFSSSLPDLSMKLYLMGIFGVADAVGSIVLGKFSDIFGRLPVLFFGCGAHLIALVLLFVLDSVNDLAILIPVAILSGLGDAVFNTQIYGILGFVFAGSSEAAFASFKFYQAASTGVMFFIGDFLKSSNSGCPDDTCPNMTIWFPVLIVPMVIGMAGILILRAKGIPIDELSKNKK